jgi:hypothetical protein
MQGMILMKQHTTEMTKSKKEILEQIKTPYRIKPITRVMVLILIAFILVITFSAINHFVRVLLASDFVGALINLLYVWNLGFWLYLGIWRFFNSKIINKVLFQKIEQFISESAEKSYDETETEVYEMVKVAYKDYTEKYNKINKIFWNCIKLSFVLLLIVLVISLF